jgi:hypothetical protein
VGEPLTSRSAGAVAFLDPFTGSGRPWAWPKGEAPRLLPGTTRPDVTTEIVAVVPAEGPIQNLWIEDVPVTNSEKPAAWGERRVPFVMACAIGLLLMPSGRPNRRPLLETAPVRLQGRVLFASK